MSLQTFDIVEVDYRGNIGSEQLGIRPSVIIQNNRGNHYGPTVIVIPLTSELKSLYIPTHRIINRNVENGLDTTSMLLGEQVRTVDKSRILYKRGRLELDEEKKSVIQVYLANLTGQKDSTLL